VNNILVTDFCLNGDADGFIEINMPLALPSITGVYNIHCVYSDIFCRSFLQCRAVMARIDGLAENHWSDSIYFNYTFKYKLCVEWELQND
jgi:hypothetical protein